MQKLHPCICVAHLSRGSMRSWGRRCPRPAKSLQPSSGLLNKDGEAGGDCDVGDVRHPNLVRSIGHPVVAEVWEDRTVVIAVGRSHRARAWNRRTFLGLTTMPR